MTQLNFKPRVYNSLSEKRAAFMQAVNMRKEWENRMRERIAEIDASKQVCTA